MNFGLGLRTEVNLCGWWDVSIQEVATERERGREGGREREREREAGEGWGGGDKYNSKNKYNSKGHTLSTLHRIYKSSLWVTLLFCFVCMTHTVTSLKSSP